MVVTRAYFLSPGEGGQGAYTGRFLGKEVVACVGTRGGVGVSGGLVLVLGGSAEIPARTGTRPPHPRPHIPLSPRTDERLPPLSPKNLLV